MINNAADPKVLIFTGTNKMWATVASIDAHFLDGVLKDQKWIQDTGGWKGKCPLCHSSHKRKKQTTSYLPAYITPRQQGYVFHCCSCGSTLTTFKLLEVACGKDTAQTYAERRWQAGKLCGAGWNCPLPEIVKRDLEIEKQKRRIAYRNAEQERKLANYRNKYG